MQASRNVTVSNENGLHARPAMQLVDCANGFESDVVLRRADGTESADAKSVMQVITLAATCGTELIIDASGPDAPDAAEALAALFESRFGEEA